MTEEQRAARKAEKRAIRDARRGERQAKRAAEREAKLKAAKDAEEKAKRHQDAQANGEPEEDESEGDESEPEDEPMEEDGEPSDHSEDEKEPADIPDLPHLRTPSPGLEPFPLPRMAPAPAPEVLDRQGLPAGLEDANFIEQDLRMPISELTESTPISERTQKRLKDLGISEFFAVQTALLPKLLRLPLTPLPFEKLSDYLVSAPTGSGKTLAYTVPIVEILSKRIVTRLRALIVLPTRDLVTQVKETLEEISKGSGLTVSTLSEPELSCCWELADIQIGTVTGQHSFAHEQTLLVDGAQSKLDILIATPGRLMDHLAMTKGFTLQHLRFLVIDEADRLLSSSFQNWLSQVLDQCRPHKPANSEELAGSQVALAWSEPMGLSRGDFEGSQVIPSSVSS